MRPSQLPHYLPPPQLTQERPHPSPRASPSPDHNYELTFKKDQQQRYFATHPEEPQPVRALFQQPSTPLVACIARPLEEYYGKSMEELASLPFADLMSAQLEPWLSEKVSLVGLILELKRMRIKMRSASLNIHCLRAREAASHEDKHRLFLLELLWKQLAKKIFLEALRLNLAQRRYEQHFAEAAVPHRPEGLQSERECQESQENSYGLWERQAQSSEEEEAGENMREKLMILVHGISHMLRKTLFSSFHRIAQSATDTDDPRNSDCESIPLASKPHISQSQQEEEDQRDYQNTTPPITYSKLQELDSLIENLHEYCAENSDDLLRKYFVRWKIGLLEAIRHSELQRLNSPQDPEEEEEERMDAYSRVSRASGASGASRESRLTSQLSQTDRTLKAEKKALKQLLRSSAARSFYCKLREHSQLRKIEALCLQIRRQSTLRKSFEALRLNADDERIARQMSAYYQEAADNQIQDDGASKLFHKTNLLCCYFRRLKELRRDQRMTRAVSKTALRLCFRRLISYGHQEKKHLQLVARQAEKNRKRLMFKCFQAWRQDFLSQCCYTARFRQYVKAREREKLHHCFSILKIQFKRALLRQRKAEQLYCSRLKAAAFRALLAFHEESRELGEKSAELQSFLLLSRGRQFVGRFLQFFWGYREYQRFSMKEERLRRTLLRLHALQALKGWRRERLKRQAYSAIELKLVRLRARQQKREILGRWAQRARAGGRGGGSSGHKSWLVRYYGGLCGVLPA